MSRMILLVALAVAMAPMCHAEVPSIRIFESDANGKSTYPWSLGQDVCYRIPSLIRTKSGVLIAAISERLGKTCNDEDAGNVLTRTSRDNGKTWSDVTLAVPYNNIGTKAERAPFLVQDKNTGKVFLLYNKDVSGKCNCGMAYSSSTDDGTTWSNITLIPEESGVVGSMLAAGVTLKNGRIIGCMRKICRNSCPAGYASKSMYSDDHGETWHASEFLSAGSTECQIAELKDGRVYMAIRSYVGWEGMKNVVLQSFSNDSGTTWDPVTPAPDLINYGFGDEGSVVSDPELGVMYWTHPQATDRSNLTIYRSLDSAGSWPVADWINVHAGYAAYSSAAILNPAPAGDASMVGVLFESDNNPMRTSFAVVTYPPRGADKDTKKSAVTL